MVRPLIKNERPCVRASNDQHWFPAFVVASSFNENSMAWAQYRRLKSCSSWAREISTSSWCSLGSQGTSGIFAGEHQRRCFRFMSHKQRYCDALHSRARSAGRGSFCQSRRNTPRHQPLLRKAAVTHQARSSIGAAIPDRDHPPDHSECGLIARQVHAKDQ